MEFSPIKLTGGVIENDDPLRPHILVTEGTPNQDWEDEFYKTSWAIPSLVKTPPKMTERGIAVPEGTSDEGFNTIAQAINRANDVAAHFASRPTTAESYAAWFERTQHSG